MSPDLRDAEPTVPSRAYWLLLAFVVVGLLLRLPLLSDPVWFEEACMSHQRLGTWEQLVAALYADVDPPLYTVFMHFWNRAFGDGEWAMRAPALLCGLASIPMLYAAGRRFVGDTAALWAAALLTLSPVQLWYSTEAGLYSAMVLCTLNAVFTSQRLLTGPTPAPLWLWLAHLANLAVMLALHYYLALFVVVIAVRAPFYGRGLGRRSGSLIAWHGLGLLGLAAFVWLRQKFGGFAMSQVHLTDLTLTKLYRFCFEWCWPGNALRAVGSRLDDLAAAAQEGLGVALAALGLVGLVRRSRSEALAVVSYFATIPLFLLLNPLFGLHQTYVERSCLPAQPFFLLLIGAGFVTLPRRLYVLLGAFALALASASLFAFLLHRDTNWTVYKPKPDWRAAAQWLGHEIDAGGAGRPIYTSMPNPRPLSYYDARIQDVKSLALPTSPEEIGRRVEQRLGTALGDLATRTFGAFADHQQRLLAGASLRVYQCTPDAEGLRLAERGRDDVAYLVRNVWHPSTSVNHTVEDLLADPRVQVAEYHDFTGIRVYKVRVAAGTQDRVK